MDGLDKLDTGCWMIMHSLPPSGEGSGKGASRIQNQESREAAKPQTPNPKHAKRNWSGLSFTVEK